MQSKPTVMKQSKMDYISFRAVIKRKPLLTIVSKRKASKIFTFNPENEQVYCKAIAEKHDNVMSLNLEGVLI